MWKLSEWTGASLGRHAKSWTNQEQAKTVFTWDQTGVLQWRIVIGIYLKCAVYTQEKTHSQICGLAFQSGEKKRGLFFDMLIDISFEIEFLLENARFIGRSG